jgi:hypothetical protein
MLRPRCAPCCAAASTSAPCAPPPSARAAPLAGRASRHGSRRRGGQLLIAAAEPGRAPPRRDGLRSRYDGYDRPPARRSEGEFYDDDDDDAFDGAEQGGGRQQASGGGGGPGGGGDGKPPGWLDGFSWRGGPLTGALAAGAFALGIGAGVALDTVVTLDRDNVASSVMFDRSSPNSDACAAFGASAVVFDQRIFLSFNPCAPCIPASPFAALCSCRFCVR